MEKQLIDLEKMLVALRLEVEQSAIQNEKLRITKDERLATDLNQRVFVDKKPNEELRE